MAARLTLAALAGMALAACAANPVDSLVADTEWLLVDLAGRAPVADSRVTLSVEPDASRLSGFTGCNRYSATASGTFEALEVGIIGLTKRACLGDALNKQESRFIKALRGTTRVRTRGRDTLMLETAAGTLVFERIQRVER